jgi:hypothetical protein
MTVFKEGTQEEVDYLNISFLAYLAKMPRKSTSKPFPLKLKEVAYYFSLDKLSPDGPEAELVTCESLADVRDAMSAQKKGGTLVVQVANSTSLSSVQLIYMLCACYQVTVYTPMLNFEFEKFLICRDYNPHPKIMEMLKSPGPYQFEMSNYFLARLDEINSIFGQVQLDFYRNPASYEQRWADWQALWQKSK